MRRLTTVLIGITCALSAQAMTSEKLIQNLSSRIVSLSQDRGSLIKSYTHHSQSYVYDQALAIIALSKDGQRPQARSLLRALQSLQMQDGSLYFSYYMDGSSPYPQEGDRRIAGALAWVAMAANHYQQRFKSKEFLSFNRKLLTYLQSQILPIEIKGTKYRALAFAPNDIAGSAFSENDVAALEHNLDAYSAFSHFSEMNDVGPWKKEAEALKKFIMALWDDERKHFWSGASFSKGTINKSELYLDNQTWSLLALDEDDLRGISSREALELNCEHFYRNHEGVKGFMDSRPVRYPAAHDFVWSEGTLGQILAMKKIGKDRPLTCNSMTPVDFLDSVRLMTKEDGGIAYATKSENKDFSNASSVAGTAWMYFAENDFNPFSLDGKN